MKPAFYVLRNNKTRKYLSGRRFNSTLEDTQSRFAKNGAQKAIESLIRQAISVEDVVIVPVGLVEYEDIKPKLPKIPTGKFVIEISWVVPRVVPKNQWNPAKKYTLYLKGNKRKPENYNPTLINSGWYNAANPIRATQFESKHEAKKWLDVIYDTLDTMNIDSNEYCDFEMKAAKETKDFLAEPTTQIKIIQL